MAHPTLEEGTDFPDGDDPFPGELTKGQFHEEERYASEHQHNHVRYQESPCDEKIYKLRMPFRKIFG